MAAFVTRLLPHQTRSADVIRIIDGFASTVIEPAADLAHLFARHHLVCTPEAGAALHLAGEVVIVEAGAIDSAVQLMLAELRKRTTTRLILISPAPPLEKRILALMLGTDHVVDAAIDPRELSAMLSNAVRPRPAAPIAPRAGEQDHRWHVADDRWVLVAPDDSEVRLTRSEHAVLALLLDKAGTILPRAALLAAINGDGASERVLDVLLSKLRRKVWECVNLELPLRSARNAGYVFAGAVRRAEVSGRLSADPAPVATRR